jgi:hypothetical protein
MHNGIHPDPVFLQGSLARGDARVGSCYGRRSAHEYNAIKALAKEMRTGKPVMLRYYAKLVNDDYIKEFIVENGHLDLDMFVVTEAADGTPERWLRVEAEGKSLFFPPPGYTGGGLTWIHDKKFLNQCESKVYESEKVFLFT